MNRLILILLSIGLVAWSAIGQPVANYVIDDGTGESSLGLGNSDVVWLNQFNSIPGKELITEIQIAFGANINQEGPPDGSPVTVGIWSDPTNDGNPGDAILLQSLNASILNSHTDTFVSFTLPQPQLIPVGDSFFVGFRSVSAGANFAIARDTNTLLNDRSWLAYDNLPNSLNLSDLDGGNALINSFNGWGFPGVALIRAIGVSSNLQGNQGGPIVAPIVDQEVTINTAPSPIDIFLGDPIFHGRDIELRIESDNQFILPNDDILLGRPGQDILLGEQPNDRLLPGGGFLPENPPPFGGGNDLLNGGGPADLLLGQGIQADQIDHRVIIMPPLRRIGSANLTVTATNPNGDERTLQFGISIISNEIIIIDDGDAGFSTSGIWGKSNALFSHDGDSLITDHAGSTAKYTPDLPGPGTYAVFAKWASRNPTGGQFDRDHGARYTVSHAGGTMTTTVNQRQNDGKFNLIGIYDFVGDGSDCVILERVNVIGGFTNADAIRFVATNSTDGNEQPGDLIIDNLSAGFSTSSHWHQSNATDGYAGDSLFTELVGNTATFIPETAPDGIHEVYVHSSARSSRGRFYNRDSKAQFEVRHAMGTSMVEVNQNVLPGQWVFIGAFQFDASGDASVKLTRNNEDSSQKTVADAVRFTELQPIRSIEVIVDNNDSGFSSFGAWSESNALDEYLQSSLAGFGAGTSAKWTPELPMAGKYQVFAHWANQGSNGAIRRDSKAWYEVQHGGEKSIVRINQNSNGGNWVSIGTFDFTGDGSEFVELFSGFASQASISADAIRFLLVD
jgi:hypothetical protein